MIKGLMSREIDSYSLRERNKNKQKKNGGPGPYYNTKYTIKCYTTLYCKRKNGGTGPGAGARRPQGRGPGSERRCRHDMISYDNAHDDNY